jgi:hypothetical protein
MKKILLPTILTLLFGCGSDFEPKLTGWTATTDTFKPTIYLNIDSRSKILELTGNDSVGYHGAQWIKNSNHLLLTQSTRTRDCYEYQIISMDTSGVVIDTIYKAPPKTALDFKLAPNDSLLILKTHNWDCANRSNDFNFDYRFTFYNRFSKKEYSDTIRVKNSLNIIMYETVWSPDSRKVIIEEWATGQTREAFIFDLAKKDTSFIDKGNQFIWSPSDKDLVAYIKDYSLYTKNIRTGEKALIFKGRKKKSVKDFRWDPSGSFLLINIAGYFLDIESEMFWRPTHVFLSISDKRESKTFENNERIDTWR